MLSLHVVICTSRCVCVGVTSLLPIGLYRGSKRDSALDVMLKLVGSQTDGIMGTASALVISLV